ncbi:MBL fold metallo-hydrolase [Luteipulveratus mongoliensis]|uniref:Zn-dependent hydrolase n=1 Tax=Luteipulveratus mongoliensis TaxID=571913 RepID=A0A0K1JJB2_9MICO|nr:MBL fold metallo-hydrolase [Luteipulveratus mongoliensis]AKU16797.1 Zn-dependent hydrolase [Luteipulveratus mongoliensis]
MSSDNTTTYDGHVTPGGPTAVRELEHAVIRKASVSEMDNNVYLITCRATGAQLLVDAADDAERVRALVAEGSGSLDAIVTTHQHWDHVRALSDVAAQPGATTYAGAADADALPVPPDVRIANGDRITVGDLVFTVIHLRGHTPGGVALAYDDPSGHVHLFTGDSLFPSGVGGTNRHDYQSFPQLIDDVEERVFGCYDDATWFYPGHGDDSTLGAERPHLAEWRARGW